MTKATHIGQHKRRGKAQPQRFPMQDVNCNAGSRLFPLLSLSLSLLHPSLYFSVSVFVSLLSLTTVPPYPVFRLFDYRGIRVNN
ncbi:hypothetical protein L2E82_46967 [Cichorium intybus]|uniref:Uncharacterized protein n=1 Tax=Cichorium intybus TaxID=13427 RepID=A0ACB8YVP1_CICIN|nr:hypothetical protein L2E82_46967 [Cichorium intybus]